MDRTPPKEIFNKVNINPPVIEPRQQLKKILWAVLSVLAVIVLIGWVVWTYQKTINETDKMAQAPAISHKSTADRETYRNEEYGFSFEYPKSWFFEADNSTIKLWERLEDKSLWEAQPKVRVRPSKFDNSDIEKFAQNVVGFGNYSSLAEGIKNSVGDYQYSYTYINNYKIFKVHEPGMIDGIYHHFFYNDNFVIDFQAAGKVDTDSEFNQILSTFKFLDKQADASCFGDDKCQSGEVCYNSRLCGELTADGEDCGPQLGDLQCHKLCQSDPDCPSTTPKCEEKEIWIGDAGLVKKFCVK
ncbi:MAG: PsbP-related protein [Patescibacteria group bacterium]